MKENIWKICIKKRRKIGFYDGIRTLERNKIQRRKRKNLKKLNLDSQQVLIDQILDNERERLKKENK